MLSHAQATTVTVRVSGGDRMATLEVVDDGAGFEPGRTQHNVREGHFGLHGLNDLVRDAGGRFDVRSSPGAGTTLHVEVPLT